MVKKIAKRKPALTLKVLKKYKRARVTELTLSHGPVRTPVYMPVGTKATIKGLVTD
jgi:tRNA-guanine family transglycosylase